MWREKFKQLQDPEIWIDDDVLNEILRLNSDDVIANSEKLTADISQWQVNASSDWQELYSLAGQCSHRFPFQEKMAAQLLPMMSVQGAWLQGLSAPGVFEDRHQLALMAVLANDVGVGAAHATRFDTFRAFLVREGHQNLTVSYADIAEKETIVDSAFRLPGLLLAMSRRSDRFADELIGVDWVFRQLNHLPALISLGPGEKERQALALNAPFLLGESVTEPLTLTQAVLSDLSAHYPERASAVLRGASWAFAALRQWDAALQDEAARCLDPHAAAAEAIQRLGRAGAVYHQKIRLRGKSLSHWLQEARTDPYPLLAALAKSKLIVPGEPEKSPLVTSLISLEGRMFRIFSEGDIAVLKRWIAVLPASDVPARSPTIEASERQSEPLNQPSSPASHYPVSLRHAYYLLQGRALSGATRKFADDYIQFWIKNAAHSLKARGPRLPESWRDGELKQWLMSEHDAHGETFSSSDAAALPERSEVIHSTLQLAPLTLIDGGWLQGFTDVRLASSTVGFSLFRTYWDELGNGQWPLNHPKIYRDVLQQMGILLPPTGSWKFAFDSRLEDASFALPVFWLSIGKFPERYQPEVVGMNLAMELSGVGGGYLSARRFLQHHGFSTAFVDLHNTIDNVQTGHSAWAAEAIEAMMRRTPQHLQRTVWQRVCVGYESLSPQYSTLQRLLKQDRFAFPRNAQANQDARHHLFLSRPAAVDVY